MAVPSADCVSHLDECTENACEPDLASGSDLQIRQVIGNALKEVNGSAQCYALRRGLANSQVDCHQIETSLPCQLVARITPPKAGGFQHPQFFGNTLDVGTVQLGASFPRPGIAQCQLDRHLAADHRNPFASTMGRSFRRSRTSFWIGRSCPANLALSESSWALGSVPGAYGTS